MTPIIAYIRVSTDDQAHHGVSLDAQRAKLGAYAVAMDLRLVATYTDAGLSAKSLDRPGLQAALAELDGGTASGLLVTKLDRLTRSVRDLGELVERYFGDRFALLSVGDSIDTRSASGRLVLNVLTSVAQWEREAVAERTRAAMAHLRAQGRHTGGEAPYGFRIAPDGTRAPVAREASTIDLARELRARGLTLRAVAAELARLGHVSRTGRAFEAQQVRRMVT